MNWKKAIGFGVLIWVIMFVVVFVFAVLNMPFNTTTDILMTIIVLLVVYILARYATPKTYGTALGYGLVFTAVGIIIDFLVNTIFASGMLGLNNIYYWISYALVALVPLLAVKKMKIPEQVSQ